MKSTTSEGTVIAMNDLDQTQQGNMKVEVLRPPSGGETLTPPYERRTEEVKGEVLRPPSLEAPHEVTVIGGIKVERMKAHSPGTYGGVKVEAMTMHAPGTFDGIKR